MTGLLLLASFVLIVGGALLFTNAIEWAGHRLDMGQGAVGSLLAAVGTALPESLIPIVAVLAGAEGTDIAIGAVIGAPFMLATIAMMLVAISAFAYRERRDSGREIQSDLPTTTLDLVFFLALFPVALIVGVLPLPKAVDVVIAALLIVAYGLYAWRTVKKSDDVQDEAELKPLTFDTSREDPPNRFQLIGQLAVGLAMIIGGAELFVEELTVVAESLGIATLVLALVLAPLATELPEKTNSFLWIRRSKDSLAVGNITGAMAFQSTIPVALMLILIDWDLDRYALAAGIVALIGGAIALWRLRARTFGAPAIVVFGGLFVAFIVFVTVA